MRTHLKTLAVAGLTLALLGWFFRQADLSQVWREIREAKAWALALLLGITGLTYLLRALRWQFLLRPIGPTRLRVAFRTTVIGFAANTILPARVGEFVRPYLLARSEGLSVPAALRPLSSNVSSTSSRCSCCSASSWSSSTRASTTSTAPSIAA